MTCPIEAWNSLRFHKTFSCLETKGMSKHEAQFLRNSTAVFAVSPEKYPNLVLVQIKRDYKEGYARQRWVALIGPVGLTGQKYWELLCVSAEKQLIAVCDLTPSWFIATLDKVVLASNPEKLYSVIDDAMEGRSKYILGVVEAGKLLRPDSLPTTRRV